MMTPLDLIDLPARNVRRQKVTPAEEAALVESIRARGVLQPVLLRPSETSNGRFVVKAGARRVVAARAVGLEAIPALVQRGSNDDGDAIDAAAENLVRVGMAPVDVWRALVRLQDEGHSLDHCAVVLGMSKARARLLDKLGRLHPEIINAIELHGLPPDSVLRDMATAPLTVQEEALKQLRPYARDDYDEDEDPDSCTADWFPVGHACRLTRIPSDRAIFDWRESGLVFDEDLFSPEEDPGHWTTANVEGFLQLQRETLGTRLDGDKRNTVWAWGTHGPALPQGWEVDEYCTWPDTKIMKRGKRRIWFVTPNGYNIGTVVGRVICQVAAKAEADQPDGDGSTASENDAPPLPAPSESEDPARLTKAGLQMVADTKTEALRSHLRLNGAKRPTDHVLGLLLIALTSRTVTITGNSQYSVTDFRDLLPDLLRPDGAFAPADDVRTVAAEALARMLRVPGPDNLPDPAPEWIGAAIGAEESLPRFDTPEFLATCKLPALRGAAADLVASHIKTAKGLREICAGAAAAWMPVEAAFGAAGPKERP